MQLMSVHVCMVEAHLKLFIPCDLKIKDPSLGCDVSFMQIIQCALCMCIIFYELLYV